MIHTSFLKHSSDNLSINSLIADSEYSVQVIGNLKKTLQRQQEEIILLRLEIKDLTFGKEFLKTRMNVLLASPYKKALEVNGVRHQIGILSCSLKRN